MFLVLKKVETSSIGNKKKLFISIGFLFLFLIYFIAFLFFFPITFLFPFPFPFLHVISFFFLLSSSSSPNNHPLPLSLIVFLYTTSFSSSDLGFSSSSLHRSRFSLDLWVFTRYVFSPWVLVLLFIVGFRLPPRRLCLSDLNLHLNTYLAKTHMSNENLDMHKEKEENLDWLRRKTSCKFNRASENDVIFNWIRCK